MDAAIIENLTKLTDEERTILCGQQVKKGDYAMGDSFIVNSAKLLEDRELDLRLHTRFVDFPEHGHDYMEFMYVYAGKITHVIGKECVTLEHGDIIFLNRHARHSVKKAGYDDIGINFILSTPFLQTIFPQVANNPVMSRFISENIDDAGEAQYLFFRTKDNFPIRNIMDNLIYAIVKRTRSIYAGLVWMLFTYLAYYRETLINTLVIASPEAKVKRAVLEYIESCYPTATLSELADRLGYTQSYLSRSINRLFNKTFRQMLHEKRLSAATDMLRTTSLGVEKLISAVGYENHSYFYRVFLRTYGCTPHQYRKKGIQH